MTRHKPGTPLPTPEEDAQINAAIAADPDDFELDEAWFANARTAAEVFDSETLQALKSLRHVRVVATPEATPEGDPEPIASIRAHPRG